MKRYKLKYDLPTFKAGDEFHISGRGNLVHTGTGIVAYSRGVLHGFPNILNDWFEEIPEKPKTVDDLKEGDKCFYIGSAGRAVEGRWNPPLTEPQRQNGCVFLTREEAEKELARRKAEVILKRDTKGFKPSRENDWRSFQVYWDGMQLDSVSNSGLDGSLTFESEEDALASIKAHEKEWKIYLGVEG